MIAALVLGRPLRVKEVLLVLCVLSRVGRKLSTSTLKLLRNELAKSSQSSCYWLPMLNLDLKGVTRCHCCHCYSRQIALQISKILSNALD